MIRRPRIAAAALVAATALAGPGAALSSAAPSRVRTVCVKRSTVVETPKGVVVGFLARGTTVRVKARSANGYWTQVRSVQRIEGWVRTKDLC